MAPEAFGILLAASMDHEALCAIMDEHLVATRVILASGEAAAKEHEAMTAIMDEHLVAVACGEAREGNPAFPWRLAFGPVIQTFEPAGPPV